MLLFFDTETTGMVDWHLPTDDSSQPDIVQLAALLLDDDGSERGCFSGIVNPGVDIPERIAAIHGITTDISARCGLSPVTALSVFARMMDLATTIVAHNIDFDISAIQTMAARHGKGRPFSFEGKVRSCTMKTATPICKIAKPNPRREDDYKWPKLAECVRIFFGEEFAGAHDALNDVRACARVYFHLRSLTETVQAAPQENVNQ